MNFQTQVFLGDLALAYYASERGQAARLSSLMALFNKRAAPRENVHLSGVPG